ncbi:PaaI family thioesterase [Leptothrix discophora]|uniref:PaaI family thioesterase n=2 Tax=Leptothrix discophora TaxID=89 RepID=A0ABT9FZI3_LEPDI|nr:PaaI family thioesterase [Leptothrix discophora]MDP4299580.1 PaaI family thioesterase [Leptothrix discophora]
MRIGNPFVLWLGFELVRYEEGLAAIRFQPRPDHHNSFDVVHGGVCMTLLDVCMAYAGRSSNLALGDAAPGLVTVEMKTQFMRPAEGLLLARATLLHRTATMVFTEGRVLDAHGGLCAHATGTFKFVRKLPAMAGALKEPSRLPTRKLDGPGSD